MQHFMAIHPIIVKVFLYGPKWWTDQQPDIAISRSTYATSDAKNIEAKTNSKMLTRVLFELSSLTIKHNLAKG